MVNKKSQKGLALSLYPNILGYKNADRPLSGRRLEMAGKGAAHSDIKCGIAIDSSAILRFV